MVRNTQSSSCLLLTEILPGIMSYVYLLCKIIWTHQSLMSDHPKFEPVGLSITNAFMLNFASVSI